jgi:hypothetical protein
MLFKLCPVGKPVEDVVGGVVTGGVLIAKVLL